MNRQVLAGMLVFSMVPFAFGGGTSHLPQDHGQDTTQFQGDHHGDHDGDHDGDHHENAYSMFSIGVEGSGSFPVGELTEQFAAGWDAGANILSWVAPNLGLGIAFDYNRWLAKENAFAVAGVPVSGVTTDGSAWLTDLEAIARHAFPWEMWNTSLFGQLGLGWFHYHQELSPSPAIAGTATRESSNNGFATSYAIGLAMGPFSHIGVNIVPAFHFDVSNRAPIAYFSAALGVSYGF
jgi:hypothetical protein